jgi:hypothetical protein
MRNPPIINPIMVVAIINGIMLIIFDDNISPLLPIHNPEIMASRNMGITKSNIRKTT